MKPVICSRAPVRICDIGGWTDTHYYKSGCVTNFAINLYSYVRIEQNQTNKINIHSENLDVDIQIQDYRRIEYDGVLDLLKAAIKRMNIDQGLDIYVRADAPPGCGTGTSASVGVALLGALAYLKGTPLLPFQAAKLAHSIETEELKLESGVQDQYASAYGGICHMEINYPIVQLSQIPITPETLCQLESRWILVYLGSRKSSDMHIQVIKKFEAGDQATVRAHDLMKTYAKEIVLSLQTGNIEEIANFMNKNWAAQQLLHPDITNQSIRDLEDLAQKNGAMGFKVNGAGGGGSAVILAGRGKEYRLKKALIENNYEIFPCILNFNGLQVWVEK